MIDQFDLFLFDFDGLLVDTEPLHFSAYQEALEQRGHFLSWDVPTFCHYAHKDAHSLKEALISLFPPLALDWPCFYQEKKKHYLSVLERRETPLMPGVEDLLYALDKAGKRRCVVTNSPREQISRIQSRCSALQTISHWFTREDYANPKPHPDGYRAAISALGKPGDRIIGFEDSLRGVEALLQTPAQPVWVLSPPHPLFPSFQEKGVIGLPSLSHFSLLK